MLRERSRKRAILSGRGYSGRMREYDEPGDDLIRPEDFVVRPGIPSDARRMGLDRATEEGAMVELAGSLNRSKASHRVIAWVLLLAFAAPLLFGVSRQLF